MGNLFARQQDWIPNIVDGAQNVNDVNNPRSSQMRSMLLSFMTPTVAIILFANAAWKYSNDRKSLESDHRATLETLQTELDQLRAEADTKQSKNAAERVQRESYSRVVELLSQIDSEESLKYKTQEKQLKYYDAALKTILDIHCSPFKHKSFRDQLERDTLSEVASDRTLSDISIYNGVKVVIEHDYKFCGSNKDNNGKFRQLYMQLYKNQLELAKEKNTIERLRKKLEELC